jgi:hypothetical protein
MSDIKREGERKLCEGVQVQTESKGKDRPENASQEV